MRRNFSFCFLFAINPNFFSLFDKLLPKSLSLCGREYISLQPKSTKNHVNRKQESDKRIELRMQEQPRRLMQWKEQSPSSGGPFFPFSLLSLLSLCVFPSLSFSHLSRFPFYFVFLPVFSPAMFSIRVCGGFFLSPFVNNQQQNIISSYQYGTFKA